MLTKLTSSNQIALLKAALSQIDASNYVEVTVENGRIVLTPARIQRAQTVRHGLECVGITEAGVRHAVAWARR